MRLSTRLRPNLRRVSACVWLCSTAVPCAALADAADTLNFSAGLAERYENNLFRLPAGTDPTPLVGKSARDDRITTATLGISLNKAYSLQQFEAGFERSSNRYATYGFLNHDTDNARAAWRWQLTPRLKGNLKYDRNQALVGFGDYRNYGTRNLRTTTVQRLDADWNMFRNGWHLRGGVERNTTSNSQVFTEDEGSRTTSADFGVRFVFPSANWIDVIVRAGQGEFLGRTLNPVTRLDDGFRDQRSEIRAYRLAGKTLLEGSLGHLQREYDHYADRDYSGGIGSLKWTWTPTGKLALVLAWKRDLSAYTDATASYYVQDSYSISPVWQLSSKVKLSFKFDHNKRDYRGPVTLLPFTAREDRVTAAQFGAEWTPYRAVTVAGFLSGDRRAATQPGLDYAARMAGASLRLDF